MRNLPIEIAGLVTIGILMHGDALSQRRFESDRRGSLLTEIFSVFDGIDIGIQRFRQIDCGEYPHNRYDLPTLPIRLKFYLVISVTVLPNNTGRS